MTQPIHPVLERVARAIHEALGESWAYCNYSGDEWNDASTRKMLDDAARAAIQALLEPSNAMVEAGYRDLLEKGDGGLGDATLCYTAMLKPLLGDEG